MTTQTLDGGQDARYRTLLALVDLPAAARELPELLTEFAHTLAPAAGFDECVVIAPAPDDGLPRALALRVAYEGTGTEAESVETVPLPGLDLEALALLPGGVILDDLASDGPSAELAAFLRQRGHRSACLLPLGVQTKGAQVVCLASGRPAVFAATDAGFLERAAHLFGLAVGNQENRARLERREREIQADRDNWRTLLEVSNEVVGTLDLEALRAAIAASLRRIILYEYINLLLFDADGEQIGLFSLDPGVPEGMSEAVASIRIEDTPFKDPRSLRAPLVFEAQAMTFLPDVIKRDDSFRSMKRFCFLPLTTPRGTIGAIVLSSPSDDAFAPAVRDRAAQAAGQVAIAIENAMAFRKIATLRDRLAQENVYLADEIRGRDEFEDIVGESKALEHVLDQVRSVADTETTVLLLGETGTGKELFARAIHNLSNRKSRTLVTVNCAASPAGLLESERRGVSSGTRRMTT